MFKFDFNIDEEELDEGIVSQITEHRSASTSPLPQQKAPDPIQERFVEVLLSELISKLPAVISYSAIHIPPLGASSKGAHPAYLVKRDLFDARFQLIASGAESSSAASQPEVADTDKDLQYVEAPSDLVPGVYEGGLKTWECSVDLAARVRGMLGELSHQADNLRTLELGCGTAIPSLMLLHEIFSQPPQPGRRVEIHLQDYNELVFRLVTLPNVILAWYMSSASASFILNFKPTPAEQDVEPEPLPPTDPSSPGDLPLSPALIDAFKASLDEYGISLRFFSGAWEAFDPELTKQRYDILLTSETIYRTDSLAALVDLMWRAYTASGSGEKTVQDLEKSAPQLSLQPQEDNKVDPGAVNKSVNQTFRSVRQGDLPICLVAAKLVYFGVGGGVTEFIRAVEKGEPSSCGRGRGSVEMIWKKEDGVKRVLMEVRWD